MASGPKRTNGVVAHVTERFGFIDLTNKNIPVSKVYFDFTSFGGKGSDLSKLYPRGTNVSFTFVETAGEHKVKHRAINLTKSQPQKGQGSQSNREPKETAHAFGVNNDQKHHGQQSFQKPHNQRSNAGQNPTGGKQNYKGGQGHPQQPHHETPHRQHSHKRRNTPGGSPMHVGNQGHSFPYQQPHQFPPHSQYSHEGRNHPGGEPGHTGGQGHPQQPHHRTPHRQHSREGRNTPGGEPTDVGSQGHGYPYQQPNHFPPRRQYSHEGQKPPGDEPRRTGGQGHHQQSHHVPPHRQYPHEGQNPPGDEQRNLGGQGQNYPRQRPHNGPKKFQKPPHQHPQHQDSDESGTQGWCLVPSGASYPHEQILVPQSEIQNVVNPGVGRVLREAIATGLNKLAEKITDQPTTSSAQYSATEQPPPSGQPEIEVAGKRKGSEQGNPANQRVESQNNAPDKAFNDLKGEAEMKKPLPCSGDSDANAQLAVNGELIAQPVPQLAQGHEKASGKKKRPRPKKDKLFQSPEVKTFMQLLGKELDLALQTKLKSLGLKSLNSLLLLRLTVGKQPSIRVFMEGETSNHTIEDAKSMELEDLQRLLRNNDTVKSPTPLHYGIKGTLHSIRSIEQNGKVTGLTLFFQLHEVHDGLGLEIVDRKGFTGVVNDVRTCPQKYIYNYLRCKSQEMAKTKDVLVLDVDGQLSGCDDSVHASLGDVTRITCSSSSELPTKITEAIEHLHECVVVIGVDSTATLKALQKMANKGASVLAEISPDMKTEVETIFA